MRISVIFVLFGLIIIVRGWVTFLQPIALTFGAMLTALNLDLDLISDIQPIKWKNSKTESKTEETEEEVKNDSDK